MTFREAHVLRSMLRMGAFTARELSEFSGENLQYVRNRIEHHKARFLEESENPRTRRVGRPEILYYLRKGAQSDLMKLLEPLYSLEEEPADPDAELRDVNPDETAIGPLGLPQTSHGERRSFYFVDVLDPLQMRGKELSETRVDFVLDEEGKDLKVSFSKSALDPEKEGLDGDRIIMLDEAKTAAGLATIYAMSSATALLPTTVVNLRINSAQIALMKDGKVLHTRAVVDESGFRNLLSNLADALKDVHNLYSSLSGSKKINQVCLSGETHLVETAIASLREKLPLLHYTSLRVDQLPHISFSDKETAANLAAIAPKIGYALGRWQMENNSPSDYQH